MSFRRYADSPFWNEPESSNVERAWEITGRTEDELTGMMVRISQVVAKQLSDKE